MSRWKQLEEAVAEAADGSARRRHQGAELTRSLLAGLHRFLDCGRALIILTGTGRDDTTGYVLDTGVNEVELVTQWLDGDHEWAVTLLSTMSTALGQKGFRVRLRFTRQEDGRVHLFVEEGGEEAEADEPALICPPEADFPDADLETVTAAIEAEMIRQLLV